ncbi:hypothetical protein BJ138DRAFT_1106409 [Hygrophoropsis aurantiaca]|uniref:Uncharacterized protein n=1 Tax=Hygrophoropsis aurantiaca TaxID=72124 RepID=A0ACB7ZVL3_9AGAM|nr:hypothetical protein BJ138DRAFT_1106409 [Hygrophoropsis aurantiaca]
MEKIKNNCAVILHSVWPREEFDEVTVIETPTITSVGIPASPNNYNQLRQNSLVETNNTWARDYPAILMLLFARLFIVMKDEWVCLLIGNSLYLAGFAQYGVYLTPKPLNDHNTYCKFPGRELTRTRSLRGFVHKTTGEKKRA